MKRYTRGEVRDGFRVVVRRPPEYKSRGKLRTAARRSIYEECETNERCLTEALAFMDDSSNRRHGVEIYIEERIDDDNWYPVLAFEWVESRRSWEKMEIHQPVSDEDAKVRVALVRPGDPDVRVWNCSDEVGSCYRILSSVRANPYAQVDGAQLHVQVRLHGIGAWGSSRYEEFRRGRWQMVKMPSELVYLRNRRAR